MPKGTWSSRESSRAPTRRPSIRGRGGSRRQSASRCRGRKSRSKTEEEEQVDARALLSPERREADERLRVREGRADMQDARDEVLDRGFVVRFLAERARELRHQPGRQFVADRDGGAVEAARRRDFQRLEADRSLQRGYQRGGDESVGERARADGEFLLLRRRQVRRCLIEDDQRKRSEEHTS